MTKDEVLMKIATVNAMAQPAPPPPECKTEAEKIAYSFGWWKALEYVRTEQAAQRPWVGLTDEERRVCTQSPFTEENYRAIEAKLKEKNT